LPKGKAAIVTQSASGIVTALATEGSTVMLNGFGEARTIEALRA
jgi:hypothetical protein